MVVSSDVLASEVGARILAAGGNAVDAAVATGFALAVTYPQAGNIGGGGFMLVHLNKAGRTVAIDYREVAPRAARRDMFLDEKGEVVPRRSQLTHLASGVPGSVAGLLHALERYGRLDRATVMAPAIELAAKRLPGQLHAVEHALEPLGPTAAGERGREVLPVQARRLRVPARRDPAPARPRVDAATDRRAWRDGLL